MAHEHMSPARMEAFSDGVLAVIITIMVLEIHPPAKGVPDKEALLEIAPILIVYLLSFVQVGIYWVNHHYLLQTLKRVTHGILWANLALLFAMSLIPVATAWTVRQPPMSMVVYGAACALPGLPWIVLSALICKETGQPPPAGFGKQVGSVLLYLGAIAGAWVSPYLSEALIAGVAVMWLIPPRQIVEMTRTPSRLE